MNNQVIMQEKYKVLASPESVLKTIQALKNNGIDAVLVKNGEEAKEKFLEMTAEGSEVFTQTSITLDALGLPKEINESGKFDSVRAKLNSLDRNTQGREMRKLGAAPDIAIGSVHAVTEQGEVLIASNTGSQLPAYAYGAGKIVWVVGTQKIVKDLDQGFERIYDYVLPLESARARKAYGLPDTFNSSVNKLLIVNKEISPGRITIILVNEVLGF